MKGLTRSSCLSRRGTGGGRDRKAAVKFTEALIGLGLGTSKRGDLAFPIAKPYTGALAYLAPRPRT